MLGEKEAKKTANYGSQREPHARREIRTPDDDEDDDASRSLEPWSR